MDFKTKWNNFLLSESNKPKAEKVERLAVFDFDGTLFRSPEPPEDFKGNWHASKKSLSPPYVDKFPDKSMWFKDIVAEAERAYKDKNTYSIMLTGRMKRNFEDRILELLEQNGLKFHYIEMNDSGVDSDVFKIAEIKKILKKFPRISLIEFWDDKKEYLKKYKKEFTEPQISVRTHKVAQTIEEVLLREQDYFDIGSIPADMLKKIAEKGLEIPPQIFTDHDIDVIDFKFELYDKPPPDGLSDPETKNAVKHGRFAVPFPPRDPSPKGYIIFNNGPGLVDIEDIVDERPEDIPVLPPNWIDPIIHRDMRDKKEESLIKQTNKLLKELFKKGESFGKEQNRHVVAFRSNVWSFGDSISPKLAKEIMDGVGLRTIDPSSITDYYSLRDALESEDKYDVLFGDIDGDTLRVDALNPSFRYDPKASQLVQKIVKEFGLKYADYESSDHSKTIRTSSEEIKGKIPDHVYHGTSSEYLSSILKNGLRPNISPTNYTSVEHKDAVFFTSKVDEAAMHAEHACWKVGGDPVVLVFRIPDPAKLLPDYDIDANAEDIHYPNIKKKEDQSGRLRGKSSSFSREMGIHGYRGRIPASFIDQVMIIPGGEDRIGDIMHGEFGLDEFQKISVEQAKRYLRNKQEYGIPTWENPEDWEEPERDEDED